MPTAEKRKASDANAGSAAKKQKTKRKWTVPRQSEGRHATKDVGRVRREIEPGEMGIWATCNKGREGKCVSELKTLFHEYAEKLYGVGVASGDGGKAAVNEDDIAADVEKELVALQKPDERPLFSSIRLDTPCSTESGLAEVAEQVLAPHFHGDSSPAKKYAIRPTIRNHTVLKRDAVIKQVAELVGARHPVDLKSYDLLILVEIYQNICGVSVVGDDFERLRKYNLAEIFETTATPAAKTNTGTADG